MSVLIETSLGDIVIDLFHKECPKACINFIKLCKIKYYNNCLFYNVQKDFIAQTGDPENTGRGGSSIYGIVNGEKSKYFDDEISPILRHNKLGVVSTANLGPNLNSSTFLIQLTDKNLGYLNEKHTVFGRIEEGFDVIEKLNKVYTDKEGRPLQNIRIKHTLILDDPFEDIPGMIIPSRSPEPVKDVEYNRLEDDFKIDELYKDQETEEKVKEKLQEHEAKNRAHVLTLLEDLPDADIKPPENVLFVCRLNPITQDDDLELIFSRFGPIKSCQIVRDWKTKKSLQYAFIEFETVEACEQAYFKMNGVVIDERRIKVDFSQSVAKLWQNMKRSQSSDYKIEDNTNELSLPNENKKFEIKTNRNFMINKSNDGMLFEHDDGYKMKFKRSRSKEVKASGDVRHSKDRSKEKHHKDQKKESSRRSKSRERHRHRSRSRDKHKHRRSRS
jgi:peptidyl-prolyl cis-trans isomerase-like 4